MSENVVLQVTELLNQEKWTRTSLTNYTIQSFKEFDAVLDQVSGPEEEEEILGLCEAHLAQSKNSVVALYLAGILALRRQTINDGNMIVLVNIFVENNRMKIAEYLAESMLGFGENRFALRVLADCYAAENKEDAKFAVWERLVRADFEEAEIAQKIAERYEAEGNVDMATSFYKKALHRFINKKLYSHIREVWGRLLKLSPHDVDFYLHAEGKIAKFLGTDRAVVVLDDLYPVWNNAGKYDLVVDVLKRILTYDPKNALARKDLVECYRKIHKDHSMLEDYIQLSNLGNSWRNVFDAISDFEKHIAFDDGNFVFHRTWGLGRIVRVKDDFITVDFIKQKGHKISLKLAVNALTVLPQDHFWVQILLTSKADMVKKVKEDVVWTLKTIIKSFGNAADIKKIKAELCPRILTDGEWTTWSAKAREELKKNEAFGNLPDKPDVYVVRDQPITLEAKTFNRFKAEKDFFNRIKILQEYLSFTGEDVAADEKEDGRQGTADSEQFREMVNYFVGFVRNPNQANEQVLAAWILVNSIVKQFPVLNPGPMVSFLEIYDALEDLKTTFAKLSNPEIKQNFFIVVRQQIKDWPRVYLNLLPQYLQKDLVDELFSHGDGKEVEQLLINSLQSYKDNRELFVWFVRNYYHNDWFRALGIEDEKILVSFIHLMDVCAREMDGKKDLAENKKLHRQIQLFLFKDGFLESYITKAEAENLARVFSLIEDVKDIEASVVRDVKQSILRRHPSFVFAAGHDRSAEIETVARGGFFTMSRSYEEKQRALQQLLEVEVPKNSKEIAVARDYGDLRENAEYKAAKERQDILNSTAARWKEELEQAKIFNPDEVDTTKISYGTTVTLLNAQSKKTETITIMGPWESNPDEMVISYLSPFGKELYRRAVGDKLSFVINDRKYSYTVKTIKKVDFSKIRVTTPVTL